MTKEYLIKNVRTVPDFPIKGILFYDETTLFKQPEALKVLADTLYETYKDKIFCRKYEDIRKFETVYSQDLLLQYSSCHDGKFYVNLSSDESVKEKSFAEIKEFMR